MLVYCQLPYVLLVLLGVFIDFLSLTYWQDATVPVPVFCCFWFQKSYKGNIRGIDKASYLKWFRNRRLQKAEDELEGGHTVATPLPGAGQTLVRAWLGCGPPAPPRTPLLRLYIAPDVKTLNITRDRGDIQREVRSRRHRLGGDQKLFPAPCRRGESMPEAFFVTMPASGVMSE